MANKSNFHRHILKLLKKTEEGMAELKRFMAEPSLKQGRKFEGIRKEADSIAEGSIKELDDAASPVRGGSRMDVFRVIRNSQRIFDLSRAAIQEMLSFHVDSDVFLRDAAESVHEACRYLTQAWDLVESQPRRASAQLLQAKKWSKLAARSAQQATSSLLKDPNVVNKMKTRDVYRHFLDIAECCDITADLIGDALVQSA